MTIFLILVIRSLKHPETGFWGEYFGNTYSATNVFTKVHANDLPSEKAGDIIVSAHLDSKSQTFKTVWRIIFYRTWLYSGIVLGGFYNSFIYNIFSPI